MIRGDRENYVRYLRDSNTVFGEVGAKHPYTDHRLNKIADHFGDIAEASA